MYNTIVRRGSQMTIAGQAEKGEKMNEMPVFKSFLRESLENQKEIEKALENGDPEKALELIRKMHFQEKGSLISIFRPVLDM